MNLAIRHIYSAHSAAKFDFVNRKFWEWCCIAQALDERCMLRTGMRGLGFAVGTEPLTAHFAGRGCEILATDLDEQHSNKDWIDTNQHANSKLSLYQPLLVNRELFEKRVTFRPADMRTLAGLHEKFDFIWSSCALEHLGTLEAGMEFVINSADLLNAGGVAVHTTEFNVLSDEATIEAGGNVLYRRQDILALGKRLKRKGLKLVPPSFDIGDHEFDRDFDTPPYMENGKPHVKLEIGGYVSTSFMVIIEASWAHRTHSKR